MADWRPSDDASLATLDPVILRLGQFHRRLQAGTLNLVAAASPMLPAALAVYTLGFSAVTAEGYPGARYHPGTDAVDEVERLARVRAQQLFRAPYANVQPLSGTAANLAVLSGVLGPGDTVMSLELSHGGHLSHVSSRANMAKWVASTHYPVDERGSVDFDALARLAKRVRPKVLICGGSACPRTVDFPAFRAVADEVDALLMADISHISGLIAAGEHPSPVGVCDVVTTSTYKQLCGPRGGLVLLGESSRLAPAALDRAVFPGFQGTPDFGSIASKAVALRFAAGAAFAAAMRRVVEYARVFAAAFLDRGVPVVTGGTDTHMVLVDLRHAPVSGREVSHVLERAGILVNKNLVPGDPRSAQATSGIRLGTNDLAFRCVDGGDVGQLAAAVADAVRGLADGRDDASERAGRRVSRLAKAFAAHGYLPEFRGAHEWYDG